MLEQDNIKGQNVGPNCASKHCIIVDLGGKQKKILHSGMLALSTSIAI